MRRKAVLIATCVALATSQAAQAQPLSWSSLPDPRGEFVRLCAPHMVGRASRPESVCLCLHDHALAAVADPELHDALMQGISETGVPTIEIAWIAEAKRPLIAATFDAIAQPTVSCMFAPSR